MSTPAKHVTIPQWLGLAAVACAMVFGVWMLCVRIVEELSRKCESSCSQNGATLIERDGSFCRCATDVIITNEHGRVIGPAEGKALY